MNETAKPVPPPGGPPGIRVRLRFTKTGKIRWTSHRDVARMWERALRRVGLPLAYSGGFSPRPKVSFGLALPTGHESVAEYLDLEVTSTPEDLEATAAELSAALPGGLAVTAAAVIPRSEPSLQEDVVSSTWRWAAVPGIADPDAALAALLATEEIVVTRTRKGREHVEDIRPSILDVRVLTEPPPGVEPWPDDLPAGRPAPVWLEADLATQPRSIRPLEVLKVLDPALDERQVRRLNQWILRDGARTEPLAPDRALAGADVLAATGAPHPLGCAS